MTKYNYDIDTTLLPEVWVTWDSKNGIVWMNNEGKRQTHPESWMLLGSRWPSDGKIPVGLGYYTRDKERVWVKSGSRVHYAYAKYHADIDRLEFAIVQYDTTRREGKHEWTFAGDRMFIGRDKTVLDQNGLTRNFTPRNDGYRNMSSRDSIRIILRANANNSIVREFKKLIGANYFIIGNGTSEQIEHPWVISRWYETAQKTRSSGKAQKFVDELVKMPLGEIGHLSSRYAPKVEKTHWSRREAKNIIYFERVNDKWSVLRGLVRDDINVFDEVWRVYLGDDGTNRITSNSNGDWIPASQQRGYWFSREYYFANPDEATEKCNRIKYIMPIFKESNSLDTFITMLRFPVIEQLYKLGCKDIALRIARSHAPKAEVKSVFAGYYNAKENGVLRQIGMTKHQLDKFAAISDGYGVRPRVLRKMRETFGDNLSHVDNDTYDKYLDAFDAMLREFWSEREFDSLNVDKTKLWKNLVRLGERDKSIYRLISDTVSVYQRLLYPRPDIDWLFDSRSDVVRTHDALTELYNHQEAERRALWNAREAERLKKEDERRKKIDEERAKYEYEDDNFIIRLPRNIQEILTEGSTQNICIGGYSTRHSRGDTNLFFLRRKSNEDAPFYAIEMNNDKRIVQIHGFGNRWLGNNPEAIPTVIRWLRKNGINCDDAILTCSAIGYGRTGNYVPMPVVD